MINAKTKLYGIIGNPIEHSISPLIHNTAFEHYNMNSAYVPLFVGQKFSNNIISSLKTLNVYGVNVTIPYKQKVISQLDNIDSIAKQINSVNTVALDYENDNIISTGYSTDFYGFCFKLKKLGVDLSNAKFLIIGNGGAATAIINSLQIIEHNKNIFVAGRNEEKLQKFIKNLSLDINYFLLNSDEFKDTISSFDIIVNTTPVGMHPNIEFSPIDDSVSFNKNQIVYDIVYNPLETKFLKKAALDGAKSINGIYMLIYQAAKSFEYWTGKEFPIDLVLSVLKEHKIIGD